jgi:hypothetical protein
MLINETYFKSDDLFMLLGLPLECDDLTQIEQALKSKQSEWSKNRNTHPRYAENYAQLCQRLPAIGRAMKDPGSRAELRQTLKKTRQEEVNRRLKAANFAARALNAADSVTTEQMQAFVQKNVHPDGPTEQQVRALITVPLKAGNAQPTSTRSVMPKTTFEEIGRTLAILNVSDLYTFLNVPISAETGAVERRQRELQDEWSKKQAGPERSAAEQSLSKVSIYLVPPDARIRYDNALEDSRLLPLVEALRISLHSGNLNAGQTRELLKLAQEYGIPHGRALQVIREEAIKAGAALEVEATSGGAVTERLCGNCGSAAGVGSKLCSTCGLPLEADCPICRVPVPNQEKLCPTCGMPVADILLMAQDIKRIEERLAQHNLTGSETALAQANAYYSRYGAAAPLQAVGKKVAENRSQWSKEWKEAEQALTTRHLYAAQRLLLRAAGLDTGHPDIPKHLQEVALQLEDIVKLLRQTQVMEAQGQGEEAAALFARVMVMCKDCAEAEAGLRRHPPLPPGQVQVIAAGLHVTVRWTASRSQHVDQYQIVRKVGGAPSHAADGVSVATINGLTFDDTTVPVGETCFYAVFAVRGGSLSRTPSTAGPVQVIAEVQDPMADVGDGVITLSWKIPGILAGVKVVRRTDRPAQHPGEGEEVPVSGQTMARDLQVTNGQMYHYRVYCLYLSPTGQTIASSGVSLSARPEPAPRPIQTLHVQVQNDSVLVQWDASSHEEVAILRHAQALDLPFGAALPRTRVHTLGTLLHPVGAMQAEDSGAGTGMRFYTALTLGTQMAVIGTTQHFACIADATGTRLDLTGGTLEAYWKWPPGTTFARVGWRPDTYPFGSADPSATFIEISRSDFERQGRLRFSLGKSGGQINQEARRYVNGIELADLSYLLDNPNECYITVFVGMHGVEGEMLASGQSSGARAHGSCMPRVPLTYHVSKKLFSSARSLAVSAAQPCEVARMVLVAKANTLPIDENDGILITEFTNLSLGVKQVTLSLPAISQGHFVKLFLTNTEDYQRFTLNHPPREKLRMT